MSDDPERLIRRIFGSEGRGTTMTDKTNGVVALQPYYESPSALAESCGVSFYVSELGCRFTKTLFLKKIHYSKFKEAVKENATHFYEMPNKQEFEARIRTNHSLLIVLVTTTHNGYNCSLFSNVGLDHLFDFINQHEAYFTTKSDNEIEVTYYYNSTTHGLVASDLYVPRERLEPIHVELYPDIDIDQLLVSYTQAQESIMLLNGLPGVGKTTFIKFLLARGEYERIAYIKDPDVMGMGNLWGKLTNESFDLLIFDDLDTGLAPRSQNPGNNFMTQLLSFSDGIFHSTNSKIIITTNQKVQEIDSALVRAGRCFDFLQLHALTNAQALNAWVNVLNLPADKFHAVFKNSKSITQAALMSEARLINSSNSRSYIRNDQNNYTLEEKLESLNIKVSIDDKEITGFGK